MLVEHIKEGRAFVVRALVVGGNGGAMGGTRAQAQTALHSHVAIGSESTHWCPVAKATNRAV
jgi:hypothetical protein